MAQMSGELLGDENVICNVCEEQIDEAVEAVFGVLQLEADLSSSFYALLVNWLDENDIDIIPRGSFE
jgi:hypothetical protein